MQQNIVLGIALIGPLAVFTILRINAAMVFLSLCLGYVMVGLVADDSDSLIRFLAPNMNSVSSTMWRLIILVAPVMLTSIIMVFSVRGRVKSLFNILPAAATSFLGLLLAIPLLTPGLRATLQASPLWQEINKAQALIVSIGAIISLVFLWTQRRSAKKSE